MLGIDFPQWAQTTHVFGMALSSLALALVSALLAFLLMSLGLRFALRRMQAISDRSASRVGDTLLEVISGTKRWLMLLAAALIGLSMLDLSDRWNARVGQLWFVAVALQMGWWATRAIAIGLRRHRERSGEAGMAPLGASATLLSWFLRTVLWAVVLLSVLSNMGVNITAFVASLGVGGIAIALAVQNILGDLFASLSIAVDKPFEVGDFIGVGDMVGTVQYIGLKSTRIRSLSGEQIIIGNTDLLRQVVKNYKRMEERRIVFKFGVARSTSPEQAEAISSLVQRLVQSIDTLRFDRAHLLGFGESSLDYEVVYIVKSPDYTVYMDAQQALNLALMRELAALGVDFAFPTRSVQLARATGRGTPPPPPRGGPAGLTRPAPGTVPTDSATIK